MYFKSIYLFEKIELRLIIFIVSLIAIVGCKKETIIQPSPSIKILSTEIKGLTTFEVVVEINQGEGQLLKNAELTFEDITVGSMSKIIEPIQISDDKVKQYKISVNTNRLNHDFNVIARLETDRYSYSSENKIIRSLKNNIRIEFVMLEMKIRMLTKI